MEELVQQLRQAGFSDDEILDYFNSQDANPLHLAGLKNLGREAVQGATFNFGDELLGMLPEWMGGGEKAKKEMRDRSKTFEQAHPVISTLAQVGGGMAVPGIGGAGLLKGANTVLGTIGRGATLGALSGIASSVGAHEGNLDQRLEDAPKAAAVGGVLGGLIPGSIAALKSTSPASRAAGRIGKAMEESGGYNELTKRLNEFAQGGRGAEVSTSDLSLPIRQAADFSANNNEKSYGAFYDLLRGRQPSATNRILDDATAKVGNPNADEVVSNLAAGTRAWADGPNGYGGLRARNPGSNPAMANDLNTLITSRAFREAWGRARDARLIGTMPKPQPASFDVMQGTLKRLADAKEAAFSSGRHDLGFELKDVQQQMETAMAQAYPEFGQVHAEYGARKGLERAVKRGQEIFHEEDTRGLRRELGQMTPLEVQQLRQGLASELISQLRNAKTNRNVAQQLVDRSQSMNDKLKLVFGSQKEFEDFVQRTELEAEMAKLKSVVGGSQTHRRGAAQEIDPVEIGAEGMVSPKAAAFVFARNKLPKIIHGRTAGAMAPDLTAQGVPAIQAVLEKYRNYPGLLPAWLGRMLPVGVGSGTGSLFDGN